MVRAAVGDADSQSFGVADGSEGIHLVEAGQLLQ
jgi:hypothetical protein